MNASKAVVLGGNSFMVSRLLASLLLFIFLVLSWNRSVDGLANGRYDSCQFLSLARPGKEFLLQLSNNLSLPVELKTKVVLVASESRTNAMKKWALCKADGLGKGLMLPDATQKLLMMYTNGGVVGSHSDYSAISPVIRDAVVLYASEEFALEPAALFLSDAQVRTLCRHETVLLEVACPGAITCYRLALKQQDSLHGEEQKFLSRRILSDSSSQDRRESSSEHFHSHTMLLGVLGGMVVLILMMFLVVLCAKGVEKYEPSTKAPDNVTEAVSNEVATNEDNVKQESSVVQDPKTNGKSVVVSVSIDISDEFKSQQSVDGCSHGSSDHDPFSRRSPDVPPVGRDPEAEKRARALSAPRSFDPLPELPKLELAKEPILERPNRENSPARGEDDSGSDDDDPYDIVHEYNADRMSNHSHSSEEGGGSPERLGDKSPMPVPYGKVSRHAQPGEKVTVDENESNYSEVRDVIRRGPQMTRDRSHTSPVHVEAPETLRDRRVHTESATHMPLPGIPLGKGQPAVKIEGATTPTTVAAKTQDKLYESVDEVVEKDLYESVPDDLTKADSCGHMSEASSLSPSKNPEGGANLQCAPASPLEVKKRSLEKTWSSGEEGKRRFSFFNRKKTSSVSATKAKKGEMEASNLVTSSSPQHKSPPLPNIPAPPLPTTNNEAEEEDNYDRVTPVLPPGDVLSHAFDDPASKSKSLPMGYRMGARSNLPLPKLPEDSGSATVKHKRVLEEGVPDEYDTVHHSPLDMPEEPNYDTVHPEKLKSGYPDIVADPPYDKVDKDELLRIQQLQLEEMEKAGSGYDPPYDRVDQDKLNELRKQEALKKKEEEEAAAAESRGALSPGYSVVRGATPEGERSQEVEPGPKPEHDEEGYAVVPKEFRMRKRAMSATKDIKKVKEKSSDALLSPDSTMAGYKVIEYDEEAAGGSSLGARSQSFSSPTRKSAQTDDSVDDQYASVDLQAKRRKEQELAEVRKEQEALKIDTEDRTPRSVSPVPPPLPPALNPEDLVGVAEEQPPVPPHMEGIDDDEEREDEEARPPSETSDPPYARVRTKVDNPYAVVNPPYTEIDVSNLLPLSQQPRAGAAAASKPDELAAMDDDLVGYDIIGAAGTKARTLSPTTSTFVEKPYDTISDTDRERLRAQHLPPASNSNTTEASVVEPPEQPYDTIADYKEQILNQETQQQELPSLKTASESNIYDSLLPQSPPKTPTDQQPPRSMV